MVERHVLPRCVVARFPGKIVVLQSDLDAHNAMQCTESQTSDLKLSLVSYILARLPCRLSPDSGLKRGMAAHLGRQKLAQGILSNDGDVLS